MLQYVFNSRIRPTCVYQLSRLSCTHICKASKITATVRENKETILSIPKIIGTGKEKEFFKISNIPLPWITQKQLIALEPHDLL